MERGLPEIWGNAYMLQPKTRITVFIQVTETQVVRHYIRCSHGRLTPFFECVQTALDQQLWLNGACANCGTQGNICCDYHGVFVGRTGSIFMVGTPATKKFAD